MTTQDQHVDLRFDIDAARSRELFGRPLITRISNVGATGAGQALNAAHSISARGHEHIPGLAIGRVHVARNHVRKWNSLPLSTKPQESVVMSARNDRGEERWCQIFSDRSLLVYAPEEEGIGTTGIPLMRALPIALKLRTGIETRLSRQTWTTFTAKGADGLELRIAPKGRGDGWTPRSPAQENLVALIRHVMGDEVALWGDEIARTPWIPENADGAPISGVLGAHLDAPHPDLEGLPYAYPGALPHYAYGERERHAAKTFLRLAWVHMLETHMEGIEKGWLACRAAAPSQARDGGTLDVEMSPHPPAGETQKETHKRVEEAFTRLLRHPQAPQGLLSMTGGCFMIRSGSRGRPKLEGEVLLIGEVEETPSAHERMRAFALFGRSTESAA